MNARTEEWTPPPSLVAYLIIGVMRRPSLSSASGSVLEKTLTTPMSAASPRPRSVASYPWSRRSRRVLGALGSARVGRTRRANAVAAASVTSGNVEHYPPEGIEARRQRGCVGRSGGGRKEGGEDGGSEPFRGAEGVRVRQGRKGHHGRAVALVESPHRVLRRRGRVRADAGGLDGGREGEDKARGRAQASRLRQARSP